MVKRLMPVPEPFLTRAEPERVQSVIMQIAKTLPTQFAQVQQGSAFVSHLLPLTQRLILIFCVYTMEQQPRELYLALTQAMLCLPQ
jgi:hypothetical protein